MNFFQKLVSCKHTRSLIVSVYIHSNNKQMDSRRSRCKLQEAKKLLIIESLAILTCREPFMFVIIKPKDEYISQIPTWLCNTVHVCNPCTVFCFHHAYTFMLWSRFALTISVLQQFCPKSKLAGLFYLADKRRVSHHISGTRAKELNQAPPSQMFVQVTLPVPWVGCSGVCMCVRMCVRACQGKEFLMTTTST